MSEMKHTPGPWSVVDRPGGEIGIYATLPDSKSDFAEFKYRTDVPVMLFHDIWVQFPPKGWDEMQRANARLMATSPDLLDSLRECRDVLAMLTDPERIKESRVQVAWARAVSAEAKARAVIQKATGGAQ